MVTGFQTSPSYEVDHLILKARECSFFTWAVTGITIARG